jgi:hypothetical protein
MAGDIPVRLPDSCHRFGVALERTGDRKHGAGNVSPAEHPMQAPESDPAPIGEHAFGRQVAAGNGGSRPLRQRGLGSGVPVRHGIFAPFLIIDHEIDSDVSAIGPARIWGSATVAEEVTRTSRLCIAHV